MGRSIAGYELSAGGPQERSWRMLRSQRCRCYSMAAPTPVNELNRRVNGGARFPGRAPSRIQSAGSCNFLRIWRAPRVGHRPLISVFSHDPQHAGGIHADPFALIDQSVLNLRECRDSAKEACASRRSRINALREGRKIRCLSVPTLSRSRKIERRSARSSESTNNPHTAVG